jgi:hypothetical protein
VKLQELSTTVQHKMAACLVQALKGFREKTATDVSKAETADNLSGKWGET